MREYHCHTSHQSDKKAEHRVAYPLRCLQRVGSSSYAEELEALYRPPGSAFYHLLLPSPETIVGVGPVKESRHPDSRRGARQVWLRFGGLRHYAGACPLSDQRIGGGPAGEDRPGVQTTSFTAHARQEAREEESTLFAISCTGGRTPPLLAATLLRLQCLFPEEALGETALHACKSCGGAFGPASARLALEQLVQLRNGRRDSEDRSSMNRREEKREKKSPPFHEPNAKG